MNKFKSRKLWMAIVTGVLVVANDGLGLNLPEESILGVVSLALGYILGESIIDAKNKEVK